jgi:hypothetical protein
LRPFFDHHPNDFQITKSITCIECICNVLFKIIFRRVPYRGNPSLGVPGIRFSRIGFGQDLDSQVRPCFGIRELAWDEVMVA